VAIQSDFTAGLPCNLAVSRMYLPSDRHSYSSFVLRALQMVWYRPRLHRAGVTKLLFKIMSVVYNIKNMK